MTEFDLGKVVGEDGAKGDKGDTGDTGNGIQSIVLRSTSGKVKTYRITFTDGDYFDYQVTDGSDANVTIVTTWNSTTSNSKVPSEKLTKDSLDSKADTSSLSSVATSGSYNDLSNKPTIPTASTSTPSADTSSGSYGSGTSYARSNHTHPKSSLYAEATHTHSEYVNPTIIDNLTTNDATKVLSAKQGKVLNDLIGDAITYINGTGGS